MQRIILALFTALVIGCSPMQALVSKIGDDSDRRMPEEWYKLPEDMGVSSTPMGAIRGQGAAGRLFNRKDKPEGERNLVGKLLHRQPPKGVEEALDLITDKNQDALETTSNATDGRLNYFPNGVFRQPWRLSFFALDLTISGQGLMGVLFARGESTVTLIWKRLNPGFQNSNVAPAPAPTNSPTPGAVPGQTPGPSVSFAPGYDRDVKAAAAQVTTALAPAAGDDGADLVLRDGMSREEIARQVEPLVAAVGASGQVSDVSFLRGNLIDTATRFQSMTSGLSGVRGLTWEPSRLRFDVSISGSGTVHTGLTVGGLVKLRFDWFPTKTVVVPRLPVRTGHPASDSMRTLVWGIATELSHAIPGVPTTPGGLELRQLKMGIGLLANGTVGIAKYGVNPIATIYFDKHREPIPTADSLVAMREAEGIRTIAMIENGEDPAHIQFAAANDIQVMPVQAPNGERRSLFRMHRQSLGDGLQRALSMGYFMAERAERRSARRANRRWQLTQVKAQFTTSLGGTTAFLTLAGQGQLEIIFIRP